MLCAVGKPSTTWSKPLLTDEHRRRREAHATLLIYTNFQACEFLVGLDEATFYQRDPKDPALKQKYRGKTEDRRSAANT